MYSCKSCGADLRFDPGKQKLICDFCDSEYDPSEFEEEKSIQAEEQSYEEPVDTSEEEPAKEEMGDTFEEEQPEEDTQQEEKENPDSYKVYVYTCPQCGGELMTTEETMATFCSYCGSSVVLESRIRNEKKPAYIIPFKKTKEECVEAYRKTVKKSLFAPSDMQSEEQVEKFRGIYMPYWVYGYKRSGNINSMGSTSRRHGDYVYTKHYNISSEIDANYDGICFDASSSFSDNLSGAIAPFEFKESEAFSTSYMSGFYADTSDVDSDVYAEESQKAAEADVARHLSRESVYNKYGVSYDSLKKSVHLIEKKPVRGMFPVWFMAVRNKNDDRVSYAVINGQTGKVAVDLPIDFKKYILGSVVLAVPLFLLLNLFLTLNPGKALIAAIIIGIISLFISNRQLNQVYCRENQLDDRGIQSVKEYWEEKEADPNGKRPVSKAEKKSREHTGLMIFGILALLILSMIGGVGMLAFLVIFVILMVKGVFDPEGKKGNGNETKVRYSAPMSQKWGTLWKPIVGIIGAIVVRIIAPVSDVYYYAAALIAIFFVLWSFLDIVKGHNRLTMRKLPQFNKRGGDENEEI